MSKPLPDQISLSDGDEGNRKGIPGSRRRRRGILLCPQGQGNQQKENEKNQLRPGLDQRVRSSPEAGPVSMICRPNRASKYRRSSISS